MTQSGLECGVYPMTRESFDLVIHNMFELGKDS
jgi:hypothetical protein